MAGRGHGPCLIGGCCNHTSLDGYLSSTHSHSPASPGTYRRPADDATCSLEASRGVPSSDHRFGGWKLERVTGAIADGGRPR